METPKLTTQTVKCEQHGLDLLNFEPIGYIFCEECLAEIDEDEE